jgi:hypothetical protein
VRDKIEIDQDNWVVLIGDPDGNNSSPYSVIAKTEDEAVEKAILDWMNWLAGGDLFDSAEWGEPEIVKVYRASWIGERVR